MMLFLAKVWFLKNFNSGPPQPPRLPATPLLYIFSNLFYFFFFFFFFEKKKKKKKK